MKDFVKVKSSIIRTNVIITVDYEFVDKSYMRGGVKNTSLFPDEHYIIINNNRSDERRFKYDVYREYLKDRESLERTLLEVGPKKKK